MDHGTALLAAVYATPREDPPRLVYGDWLLERGDPRGELIALQYERRSAAPQREPSERETRLLDEHAASWLGSLTSVARQPEFERGFLSSASISANDEAVEVTISDPRWSTLEHLVVRWARSDASRAPGASLVPRLRALRSMVISCDTAEVVADWTKVVLPAWDRVASVELDAPGLNVRFSRRGDEADAMSVRAELSRAWTYWANRATGALFVLFEALARTSLRNVQVIDSRPEDRLTHREVRRLRRVLDRHPGIERVKLPKA